MPCATPSLFRARGHTAPPQRGNVLTPAAPARPDVSAELTDGAHLIGGEWVPARGGETFDVINPATGDLLLRVPRGRAEDIDAAVRAAEDAFPAWRDTSPAVRAELLYRWADEIRKHEKALDLLESME